MLRSSAVPLTTRATAAPAILPDCDGTWRRTLPALHCGRATLRVLRTTDAVTLLAMLSTEEVRRFISPPPTTVAGFERFIEWTEEERAAGRLICFGIVPEGYDGAVGLIQVRALEPSWAVCEWGFAIGSSFWGSGIFYEAAQSVATFVFSATGAHRIEARACVENNRGNGVLQKLGAFKEGLLRASFSRHGRTHDQYLWAISAEDWRTRRQPDRGVRIH